MSERTKYCIPKLEWSEKRRDWWVKYTIADASTIFGYYCIGNTDPGVYNWLIYDGRWWTDWVHIKFNSIDAAKAAAQSHYEQRMASGLEVAE